MGPTSSPSPTVIELRITGHPRYGVFQGAQSNAARGGRADRDTSLTMHEVPTTNYQLGAPGQAALYVVHPIFRGRKIGIRVPAGAHAGILPWRYYFATHIAVCTRAVMPAVLEAVGEDSDCSPDHSVRRLAGQCRFAEPLIDPLLPSRIGLASLSRTHAERRR